MSVIKENEDILKTVHKAVAKAFTPLKRPVQKNLANLTVAFLHVLSASRSGYGHLSLAALFRVLPTEGTLHAREKRLRRFLDNRNLDPWGVSSGLAKLIFGSKGAGLWPIVFDQTKSGASQALMAGVPFEGRTLPLAIYTFDYPWKTTAPLSQNDLERIFLADIEEALPKEVKPIFIGDRGYARAALLRQSNQERRLYIIRGRSDTVVEHRGNRVKLRDLKYQASKVVRYRAVLYQSKEKVEVDVVVFKAAEFEEPWYLLVPSLSENILSSEAVVSLYRERMQIEQSFRDFKTHLGLRGLKLKVRIAERTGRVMLAFCIAYCLAICLGASKEAEEARDNLEILRKAPRHGTRRTLSALSLAMQMLSHPKHKNKALNRLKCIAERIALGLPALSLPPPKLELLAKVS
jgi:hypothetical protein